LPQSVKALVPPQSPDGSGQAMERDKLLHFKTLSASKYAGMNSRAVEELFFYWLGHSAAVKDPSTPALKLRCAVLCSFLVPNHSGLSRGFGGLCRWKPTSPQGR